MNFNVLSALLHSLLHRVIILSRIRLSPKLSSQVDVIFQVAFKVTWLQKRAEMTHFLRALLDSRQLQRSGSCPKLKTQLLTHGVRIEESNNNLNVC